MTGKIQSRAEPLKIYLPTIAARLGPLGLTRLIPRNGLDSLQELTACYATVDD